MKTRDVWTAKRMKRETAPLLCAASRPARSSHQTKNMKSHVVIFNRSALQSADGWIHIVPKGELPNREAGIVQVLDDQSLDSIMTGITQDRDRLGDKWPGIYAGREHFIYHPDQDSAALAWFKEFQKRDDGIWAKDDGLTPIGSEAVKNRLYKFTSFVADRGNLEKVDDNSPDGLPRYRVKKIETVGFTNQANGRELLTPITNRSEDAPEENDAALRSGLIALLRLPANTTGDAISAEITRLQNRAATLEAENQTLLDEQVDAILAEHKLTDPKIVNRLKPMLVPLADRAGRVQFLAELGLKPEAKNISARVLNRGGSRAIAAAAAADDEQTLARKIQNRAGELQASGLKFDPAWKQAQREITQQPAK